jgi:hypothetical protein
MRIGSAAATGAASATAASAPAKRRVINETA